MTVVEFFDEEALDNAAGVLLLKPERLVLLHEEGKGRDFSETLGRILKNKNIKTEIITEDVDVSCVGTVRAKIEEIALRFPDCDFDISGGNDIMLVAMGEVAKKHSLPMHSVNVAEGAVTAVNSAKKYTVYPIKLTVEELIRLHGGRATNENREIEASSWKRNMDAERDIEKVWEICKSDPQAWNGAMGKWKNQGSDKTSEVWAKLRGAGLVKGRDNALRYKNTLVRYLVSRQGTALEMYTFICAKEAGMFDDGQSGVMLDWIGRGEVENEIDVLLTRGAVGYFISCKNGMVDSTELYKLDTVASRFGGRYAKKMLVISSFEPDFAFMKRAEEMGIRVIKNVKKLTKKDFVKKFII